MTYHRTNLARYRDIEFQPADEIRRVQEVLLREHVNYCAANSPYYRALFEKYAINPGEITLDNLPGIPPTGKEDLESKNDEFIATSTEKIVDIVFSSGTTGRPTRIVYTENDLQRLAYNEHQSFGAAGVTEHDTVLLTCTMDRCFVAGLAYFLGTRSIGAAAVRNGHGTMESHLEIIQRIAPSVIVGVPSFLLKLAAHINASGNEAAFNTVEKLFCIGEPVRNGDMAYLPAGEKLKNLWDTAVYSTYASTETVTTFCECTEECGGHLHPELAVVEVLDEEGTPAKHGSQGEVVVTPLGAEGMPLLRFKTGDISFLIDEPCGCGRRSPRLGPVLARKKQMIKLKGTTLYPQTIALALGDIPEISEHLLEVSSSDDLSDSVTVHVALNDPALSAEQVAKRLQSRLRVKPEVVIQPLAELRGRIFSPQYRKPIRFIDRREKRETIS